MNSANETANGWGRWMVFLVGALLVASYWVGLWPGAHHFTAEKVSDKLARPLLQLLASLGVGLLVGQAIESLGWAAKLGSWVAPLLRWGHLSQESGASFTAAFFPGILDNTILVTLYQEGRISRQEMTITFLLNSGLPNYLVHMPTTFFIILPLARQAGLIYLGITLAATLIRSAGLLIYSRWLLPADQGGKDLAAPSAPKKKLGLVQEIWQKFQRRFFRVILFTVPIYFFIFVLNDCGFFNWLRDAMAIHVSLGFLPIEAASVVIFSVATEFTAGVAAAGAFLQAGALTVPQTVMALVLGNIVATPVRALRHQLPSTMGIFSPKLGTELLLMSHGLRLLSLLLVAVPYAVWGAWA